MATRIPASWGAAAEVPGCAIGASEALYGPGKSIAVYAPDWPQKNAPQPVPAELIVPADLTDWRYRAGRGQILLDPVTGRMVFPARQTPKNGVWVDYRIAFSADMVYATA